MTIARPRRLLATQTTGCVIIAPLLTTVERRTVRCAGCRSKISFGMNLQADMKT